MTPWQSLEHPSLSDPITCTRHPHTPHARPPFSFSPRPCTLLSALSYPPPAPMLPWGTCLFSFAPACTRCLDERRPHGAGLAASGLHPWTQMAWTLRVWLILLRTLFGCGSLILVAVLGSILAYTMFIHSTVLRIVGLPRLGLVPRRGQERASPWALGFRSLNWLHRAGRWKPLACFHGGPAQRRHCVLLARRDVQTFRGYPSPKIKTRQRQEEPVLTLGLLKSQTRVVPSGGLQEDYRSQTACPLAPTASCAPPLMAEAMHRTWRSGGRCPLPFVSKGKVADGARKRPVLGPVCGEPRPLPRRTNFYQNPPQESLSPRGHTLNPPSASAIYTCWVLFPFLI